MINCCLQATNATNCCSGDHSQLSILLILNGQSHSNLHYSVFSFCTLISSSYSFSSYGQRVFSMAGPAMWNWLPDSLRDPAISRDSFKLSLKTFLFSAYPCTECIRAFWTMRCTNLLTYLLSLCVSYNLLSLTLSHISQSVDSFTYLLSSVVCGVAVVTGSMMRMCYSDRR